MENLPMSFKTMFRRSGIVYKRNFSRLFLPLLLFQLVLLVPLMFFTMPGTVSVARSLLLTLSRAGRSGLSSIGAMLSVVAGVAVFVSPLMVSNVVYVIHSDYIGRTVTFREAAAHARRRYGGMLRSYFAAIALLALPVAGIVLAIIAIVLPGGVPVSVLSAGQLAGIVVLALAALLLFFGIVFLPYTVAVEGKHGFAAVLSSYRYAFLGNFWCNFTRVLSAAVIVGLAGMLVNWLSRLPFRELYDLYLADPMLALQDPLMIFVILLALAAIVVGTFVFPFWYAFTYHTYRNAKWEYERKKGA